MKAQTGWHGRSATPGNSSAHSVKTNWGGYIWPIMLEAFTVWKTAARRSHPSSIQHPLPRKIHVSHLQPLMGPKVSALLHPRPGLWSDTLPRNANPLRPMQCSQLDGTEPESDSPVYTEPIRFTGYRLLVRAKAFLENYAPSDTASRGFGALIYDKAIVSTLAGEGKPGLRDGTGTNASFYYWSWIRKIRPDGMVTTLAVTGSWIIIRRAIRMARQNRRHSGTPKASASERTALCTLRTPAIMSSARSCSWIGTTMALLMPGREGQTLAS